MDSTSPTNALVVLVTTPNQETAETLAMGLVEERLAACVNVIPKALSFYRWDNQIQRDEECLLIVKTTKSKFQSLSAWVEKGHPYDIPEIIALPIHQSSDNYLKWILNEVAS